MEDFKQKAYQIGQIRFIGRKFTQEIPGFQRRRHLLMKKIRGGGGGRAYPALRGRAPVHAEGQRRGPIVSVLRGAVGGHRRSPAGD